MTLMDDGEFFAFGHHFTSRVANREPRPRGPALA